MSKRNRYRTTQPTHYLHYSHGAPLTGAAPCNDQAWRSGVVLARSGEMTPSLRYMLCYARHGVACVFQNTARWPRTAMRWVPVSQTRPRTRRVYYALLTSAPNAETPNRYLDITLAQARKIVPWRILRRTRKEMHLRGLPRAFAHHDGVTVELSV